MTGEGEGATREGRSLLICGPAYQARLHVRHVAALTETIADLTAHGWVVKLHWLTHCARITRARNELMATFGASGCEFMLSVDADVSWPPGAVRRLLDHDQPFVAATTVTRGTQRMCIRPVQGREDFDFHEPTGLLRVGAVGAAFILLRRDVLDRMAAGYPELKLDDDRVGDDRLPWLYGFFNEQQRGTYLEGEDYAFCERWRAIGGEIFVDPGIVLSHFGEVEHSADLSAGIRTAPGVEAWDDELGLAKVGGVWCPKDDLWFMPRLAATGGRIDAETINRACALAGLNGVREGTALDIGAHIGIWARQLAERFAEVIALEPDPANFGLLERNTADCPGVVRLPLAAGSRQGKLRIARQPTGANSGQAHVALDGEDALPASAVQVDQLDVGDLRLIKIDAEGYELPILQGAVATLEAHRPVVVIEENDCGARYGFAPGAARAYLERLGMREAWRHEFAPGQSDVIMTWEDAPCG